VQARYKAEVDRAQAEAPGRPAGPGTGPARGAGRPDRTCQRGAALRQQQLVAEVVKPAEAEAEKVRLLAQAEAERMRVQAEAAASHNRVALDRMLIDQLPQIVREAAAGLQGANVNILNGADGISELAASLVGQGLTIFESLRTNLGRQEATPPAEGRPSSTAATDSGHTVDTQLLLTPAQIAQCNSTETD